MILNSPYISGSLTVTGNTTIQGQLTVTGSLSGTASLASNALLLQGTGSTGFATTASVLQVSSSQQQISSSLLQVSASYTALSGSYNTFSGSNSTILTAVSSSQQQISSSYIALSGSYNVFSGSASTRITVDSASLLQVSSSQQQISASLLNVVANYATTGSNSFRANQSITGSLVVSSTITAQTLVVQTITSSVEYSSGSNIFGSTLSNTQTFTGSLNVTGSSHTIFGSVGINTTAPTVALQVYSTGSSSSNVTAEFWNGDYGTGTRNFIRLRNAATLSSTTSAYIGQGQDQKTYIYNNDPSRPGDIVITNTGKVGIGISSPNSQLHISSFDCVQTTTLATAYTAAKFRLDTYCGSGQGISMGNITGFQQYIQAQYSNCTTTNPLMLNPFGGIVGIGTDTNNPTGQKLFIQSANDQAGITMYNSYDCNMWALATGTTGINNKGFAIRDEINGVTRLQFDNCGNVGIGTLSPGGRLDVVTCSNTTQNFYLRNTNNLDGSSRSYFNVVAGNTSLSLLVLAGGGSCGGTYIAGTCGADMYIQQAPSGNNNIVIKANGYVGINVVSACKHLEVGGTIRTTVSPSVYYRDMSYIGDTYQFGSSETSDNVDFKICGGSTWSTGGNFRWFTQAGNTTPSERMRITAGGSVGISATNPRTQLDVGDIHDGVGGTTFCAFLVAQGTWATFACVTNGDTNVVTDITYVNNNDYNRSGVFVARWAYNTACAALHIVSCLWNDSQNINQFGLRNNSGALQICLGGGANGYRVQARVQGARATG